jgi:ATP-dependent Clp protease, protease subunit
VIRPDPWPGPHPRPTPQPSPPGPPAPWPAPLPAPEPSRVDFVPTPPTTLALDLADRLLARRIVVLTGPLGRDEAGDAVARLMLLDADADEPIQLHLTCPDGDLDAALVLAETVDLLRAPVTAVLRGTVGGPALAVVAAADRVEAHPHCILVLREPRSTATGRADELAAAADQHARQVDDLCSRLASATGRDPQDVTSDLRGGRVLDAGQAVEYGLVDEVTTPRR